MSSLEEKFKEIIQKEVMKRITYLKSLEVEDIITYKEKNTFYNEEIIVVGGTPTDKTWRVYRKDKDKLKNQGYYVNKKGKEWFFFVIIVPSRYYNELVEMERRSRVIITKTVSDSIKSFLKPHQVEVIDYNFNIFKEKRLFIDTSDAGTGKTYVSLALVKEMNLVPILVIPAVSIPGWLRALNFYQIRNYYISTYELFKRCKFTTMRRTRSGKWVRENVEFGFIRELGNGDYQFNFAPEHCVIFDEAHRLKNMHTLNFKFFEKMMEQENKPYMMFLSATISESPAKAVPVFYAMGMNKEPKGFSRFMYSIGCYRTSQGWEFDNNAPNKQDCLIRVHELMAGYGQRMKLNSIDGLPPNTIIPELYSISESTLIENLYKTMNYIKKLQREGNFKKLEEVMEQVKKMKLSISDVELIQKKVEELQEKLADAKLENYALAIRTRLLQIIELNKLPLLMELATSAIEDGYHVAVFLNYTDSIDIMAKTMGTRCIFTGKNHELGYPDREYNRVQFQEGKEKLIIGTFSAMRESVDLHDIMGGRPRMTFMPFSDSAQSFIQALGRVHRTGKKSPSVQYVVCIQDTIEEKVKENLEKKLFNLSLINDGDLDPEGVYQQIYGGETENEKISDNDVSNLQVVDTELTDLDLQ